MKPGQPAAPPPGLRQRQGQRAILAAALSRWQRGTGAFWPYVGSAPFLCPASITPEAAKVEGPSARLLGLIQRSIAASPDALFLDLSPGVALPLTPALNRCGLWVVPAIQRWPATTALLPCARLQQLLVACSYQVAPPQPVRGVAFLLDGDRVGPGVPRGPGYYPTRFDNRHRDSPNLLPPAGAFRRWGIGTALAVSRTGTAPDLGQYLTTLSTAGMTVRTLAVSPRREHAGLDATPRIPG